MTADDWPRVAAIYADGIATGDATFETDVPTREEFAATKIAGLSLVAEAASDGVVGWVGASRVSSRPVYAGVVEHSVYVAPGAQGRGLGRALLGAFLAASEDAGVWTVQTRIFPENRASLAVHATCGFRTVGTLERLGQHGGRWRDVVLLERRSRRAGC